MFKRVCEQVQQVFAGREEGYAKLARFVRRVVLPHGADDPLDEFGPSDDTQDFVE